MLITVDTGGTKTLVASFSENGIIAKSVKFPTPKNQSEYIEQLSTTIHEVADKQPIEAIVVAMPGIIKDGVAIWCNHLGWANFDVRSALTPHFPNITILVENDANLGGLGEARRLNPVPTSVLYVTISTGIGTGYITNGTIDQGLRLSEAGRSLVEFDGTVREWESFGAGSSVRETYGMYASEITNPRIWKQIADRISRGFLALIPIVQPDVIIIGGSMGTHFEKYRKPLLDILRERLPAHIPVPKFIQAQNPEEAVIYGCYYYALDTLTH